MHLRFFNPYAEVRHTGTTLPHWQQQGAVYFLTFRTADSVPVHLLAQWENERETWLKWNPLPHTQEQELEYHRRFSGAIEGWGGCRTWRVRTA